jgi:hypothetical protein
MSPTKNNDRELPISFEGEPSKANLITMSLMIIPSLTWLSPPLWLPPL